MRLARIRRLEREAQTVSRRLQTLPATPLGIPALLTDCEVAIVLGMSVSAVRRWRIKGGGPPIVKIGKSVRYRQADLQDFIDNKLVP